MQIIEEGSIALQRKKNTKTYRDIYALYYQVLGYLIENSPQSICQLRYKTCSGGSSFKNMIDKLIGNGCIEPTESVNPFRRWYNRSTATIEKVDYLRVTEKGKVVHEKLSKYLDYLPNEFLKFEQ